MGVSIRASPETPQYDSAVIRGVEGALSPSTAISMTAVVVAVWSCNMLSQIINNKYSLQLNHPHH